MRVAIVHDWLYVLSGAERVLREMLRCYPNADVFTLFDTLTDAQRSWIGIERSHTSFMQRIPGVAGLHPLLLPLMPYAIEQFDLQGYDLVISCSSAVAKGVITGPDQLHVAYVHSPMRYAWDLQHQYLRERRGLLGIKSLIAAILLHNVRVWDTSSGSRANTIIANSAYIGRRVKKAFGRPVHVIHPPVDVTPCGGKNRRLKHFLSAGRLVGYKNAAAIVEAFKLLPDLELIVAGTGPDAKRLKAMAGPNVTFAGYVNDREMRRLMATAQALVYAAEEDFGIICVEAQAEGTPVIALGRGGVTETVVADGPRRTGLFFENSTPEEIAAAVNAFLARREDYTRETCQAHALSFSGDRFQRQLKSFIDTEIAKLRSEIHSSRVAAHAPVQLAVAR
jgi:glycosyltransferase involved in cell wall biosynthesis